MTNHLHSQPRRAVDLRIPAIEKYAYCLCLHVKPTTIFIAVFKLIRSLLFASILLNTEFTLSDHSELLTLDERNRSTAIAVSILSRIIIASVSALAIYAVVSSRAALLMPLYGVLLVDFFFALPAFYNRELYDPSLADNLSDLKNYHHRDPNQLPRFSVMLFSVITMIARIYFLCVIWRCYRYLRLVELVASIRINDVYPHIAPNIQYPVVRVLGSTDSTDLGPGCGSLAPPSYDSIAASMKPPNYEEAIKSPDITVPFGAPVQQLQQAGQLTAIVKSESGTINQSQQYPSQTVIGTQEGRSSIVIQTTPDSRHLTVDIDGGSQQGITISETNQTHGEVEGNSDCPLPITDITDASSGPSNSATIRESLANSNTGRLGEKSDSKPANMSETDQT